MLARSRTETRLSNDAPETPAPGGLTPEELRENAPATPGGLSRDVGLQMLFQAMEMDDAPARIGRFEVRGRLGRGAMGSVFRAFDPELQREVALKVLDGTFDAAGAEAMRKEARALARLAHPHVVTVFELGIERGQAFVAMEYVPGQTVRERVQGPNPPDIRTLLEWFLQAGRGLQAAHEAGLVHRDIKPDNILVADDGRIRVADFGLARTEDQAPDGVIAGTPSYMAPEVAFSGLASSASDQYAFCASLWRLLDPHAELSSASADIPVAIRAALTRGLADDPKARWPSMADLLDALEPPSQAGPEAHQRAILLSRVERLWVQGVLQASLDGGPVFELPLSDSTQHVDTPLGEHPLGHGPARGLHDLLEAGHGSLLLLGEPGAGKTTTLIRLAAELLTEARLDPRAPAPVVLTLASLAGFDGPFELWVEDELVAKYGLPRSSVRRRIERGDLVLLLDGLDEIRPSRRHRCIEALNAFRESTGLPMAITCRTSDYNSLPDRLRFGHAVVVDPLPPDVVLEHLGLTGSEELVSTLRTPLMVSLLARSEVELPEEGARLPWLYERYLDHQLSATDPTEREGLLETLGFFASALDRSNRTELWLEQLAPGWVFGDGRAAIAHGLSLFLLTLICLIANVSVGAAVEGDPFSGFLYGLISIPTILVFTGGLRIQPMERLRFSFRRLARLVPMAIVLGGVLGTVHGAFYAGWPNVYFAIVGALVISVTVAFEPSEQESRIRPNQGMRQSLLTALGIGALGSALGAVVFGYVAVPLVLPYLEPPSTLIELEHPSRSAAAVAAPLLGVIAGMVRGGWTVIQHISLRVVMAAAGPVPLAIVPVLDRAVDLGLMRRVGGGYLFLHRTFQETLAGRSTTPLTGVRSARPPVQRGGEGTGDPLSSRNA